jgi:hypothetical protein
MADRYREGHPDAGGRPAPVRVHGALFDSGGRDWRLTADSVAAQPVPTQWLASCHSYLVDDVAGRPVGVVDDVVPHATAGLALMVVAPRRCRLVVPVTDVVGIEPGDRRLTVVRGQGWIVERPERTPLLHRLRRWALRARLTIHS